VAGGATVAVALGSASSLPQAMAKSKTALRIANRITYDFLTGLPPFLISINLINLAILGSKLLCYFYHNPCVVSTRVRTISGG
jgi:hypothetical protein